MKIYLWLHGGGCRSIHEANPHVDHIYQFIFAGDHITEEEFNFLVENANLVDSNDVGWKVWELEL
jgi:hypothetical protein